MAQIDLAQLALDLLIAKRVQGYGKRWFIVCLAPKSVNPIRFYIEYRGEVWPVTVTFSTYPFPQGLQIKNLLSAKFQERIPPCPKHQTSWHPNVDSNGLVCWGNATMLPGNGVINLLEAFHTLLRNPEHRYGFRQCKS